MSANDWLLLAAIGAIVFALAVYGFLAWRSYKGHSWQEATLDSLLAGSYAAAAIVGSRSLLRLTNPTWIGRVLLIFIILLPAIRSLREWIAAQQFVSAAEVVLDE
jgi:hypothetical protein